MFTFSEHNPFGPVTKTGQFDSTDHSLLLCNLAGESQMEVF